MAATPTLHHEQKWKKRMVEVAKWKQVHGCLPSRTQNETLARWLRTQKEAARKGHLRPDRCELLANVGFEIETMNRGKRKSSDTVTRGDDAEINGKDKEGRDENGCRARKKRLRRIPSEDEDEDSEGGTSVQSSATPTRSRGAVSQPRRRSPNAPATTEDLAALRKEFVSRQEVLLKELGGLATLLATLAERQDKLTKRVMEWELEPRRSERPRRQDEDGPAVDHSNSNDTERHEEEEGEAQREVETSDRWPTDKGATFIEFL